MSISERDSHSIWHPFTPQLHAEPPLALVRGEGALLYDEAGKSYIDAISSWWVNLHGHAHPYIAEKICKQVKTLEHAIFSGYTHLPAVELAEKLLDLLPHHARVFYSDDGSTSVEVALKMAFQFWSNQDKPRKKVIAFENAYHGDTFGSMSVGARNVFNNAFESFLFDIIHIPVPVAGREQDSLKALEENLSDEVAAFIFEPLVQGAGGMVMYEAEGLDQLLEACRKFNVVCIADEVMTGFGRTGKMFATDFCKNKPDITCLSKGLTGGFLPLGATLCSQRIYDAFLVSDRSKTFFHGHSYTGNPLACVAATASLEVFGREKTFEKILFISEYFQEKRTRFAKHPRVKYARNKGVILALELKTNENSGYLNSVADRVQKFFQEKGIILRSLGNVLYVLPPYCITKAQLDHVMNGIEEFIEMK